MSGAYFVTGYSPRPGLIGIVAYLNEFAETDVEHTRFYMYGNGKWHHREIKKEIRSVVYTDDPCWWLLDKRGEIVVISKKGVTEEKISKEVSGNFNKLALVDGKLYACGLNRQIYIREGGYWRLFSEEILHRGKRPYPGFIDIHGDSSDNIFAVGFLGEVFHYDGSEWSFLDSGTNVTLRSVTVKNGKCFIFGKKGTVLEGNGSKLHNLSNEELKDSIWGSNVYKEHVYFNTFSSVVKFGSDVIATADTSLSNHDEFVRLAANDEELWAIKRYSLSCYNGSVWENIKCPDNNREGS